MPNIHRGWMRLWIVASLVLGAITFAVAMSADTDSYFGPPYDAAVVSSPERFDGAVSYLKSIHPEIAACSSRIEFKNIYNDAAGLMATCEKTKFQKIGESLLAAIVPAFLLLIVGVIVAWVRRGFDAK